MTHERRVHRLALACLLPACLVAVALFNWPLETVKALGWLTLAGITVYLIVNGAVRS